MYSIKVEGTFSSAHNLRGYKGKCEELHGHNWKVEIELSSAKLDKIGMVADFKYLKEKLNKVLTALDHRYLNDLPYFKKANPTSENIARHIFGRLKPSIKYLRGVTVWESNTSRATYGR